MKQFALFTTDVFGQMRPSGARGNGQYTVIPAGGERESQEWSRAAAAMLKLIATVAQQQGRKADAAPQAARARDDRGGLMLIKRGNGSVRNDLERLDAAIVQLSTPSVGQVARQLHSNYAAREARLCAEAKAAYDARNPHKRREG